MLSRSMSISNSSRFSFNVVIQSPLESWSWWDIKQLLRSESPPQWGCTTKSSAFKPLWWIWLESSQSRDREVPVVFYCELTISSWAEPRPHSPVRRYPHWWGCTTPKSWISTLREKRVSEVISGLKVKSPQTEIIKHLTDLVHCNKSSYPPVRKKGPVKCDKQSREKLHDLIIHFI